MAREDDLSELGLSKDASFPQTSNAYLRLSLQRHPDKGGTNEGFQTFTSVYPRLKQEHDAKEAAAKKATSQPAAAQAAPRAAARPPKE